MAENVKSRRYHSPLRQEQAARTRQRILDVAAELFVRQGYGTTSIRQIAEAAEVAADTVYATFGTKARLLTAILDMRLAPGGESIIDRAELQWVRQATEPQEFLRRFADDYSTMSARVRPVSEVLRTAKAVDPEMAAIRDEMEGYRFQYMRTVVGWLAKLTKLTMPVETAAQVVWTLASPDVGRMLCDVQGWTAKDYAKWLGDTLIATLLPRP